MVTLFKYLGQVLMAGDYNWTTVVLNLKKARKSWTRLMRILGREGANPRVSRMKSKVVVQAVLIFRSEVWVLTPRMERDLGSFQHRVARRIIGRQSRRREEGGWDCPPLTKAMEDLGFEEIGAYILKIQNTVAQYIATRPMLDLCERYVWRPRAWVSQR